MAIAENQAPPDDNTAPAALTKILEAAEAEFAEKGFEGAAMKALAARAGVSQSLLHYHFGSKENLYATVIRERSSRINDERCARLATVDLDGPEALEQIIVALFAPALGPAGGGQAYARIFAGLIVGNARDQALVREYYDPTATRFLDAIQTALPRASRAQAAQIYQFALGVLASVISRDGRMERLMGDETARLDDAALIRQLTRFVAGGAQAITN